MDKKEIKAQTENFCNQPKGFRMSPEGVKTLAALPAQVQSEVNKILEARRGFRRVNGVIEFTKTALKAEIERLETKYADTKASLPILKDRIEDLKTQLEERNNQAE